MGEHGSYVAAAESMGMDFPALVNRLVEVTSARYFGTPVPPKINVKSIDPVDYVFTYLTQHRDRMDKSLKDWCSRSSRTSDPVGRQMIIKDLDHIFHEIKMRPAPSLTNGRSVWTWETIKGLQGGTLFLVHVDVPFDQHAHFQKFRRDPEWFYGEGIGSSWAPITVLEYVFRALRSCRRLRSLPIGILCYGDEGYDCRYSGELITKACAVAGEVIVMRPGNAGGKVITSRRGQRKYSLIAEGKPVQLGKATKNPEVLRWASGKIDQLGSLTSRKKRLAVSAINILCDSFPKLLPHRVTATLLTSFSSRTAADNLEKEMEKVLGKGKPHWHLELISDRPPMRPRKHNKVLFGQLSAIADKWDIPFDDDSSVWPSVAGIVPDSVPVICGMGPVARDLSTSQESVERASIMQRALLIVQFLASRLNHEKNTKKKRTR
jgi:D-alanine-D-alanine ligase